MRAAIFKTILSSTIFTGIYFPWLFSISLIKVFFFAHLKKQTKFCIKGQDEVTYEVIFVFKN